MPLSELRNKYRKTSSLEKARNGWEDEYDISSKQVKIIKRHFLVKCLRAFLWFIWKERNYRVSNVKHNHLADFYDNCTVYVL